MTLHHRDYCPALSPGVEQLLAEQRMAQMTAKVLGREVGPLLVTNKGTLLGLIEPGGDQ